MTPQVFKIELSGNMHNWHVLERHGPSLENQLDRWKWDRGGGTGGEG